MGNGPGSRERLPVEEVLGEVWEHLRDHPCCVLAAPPGSGKTTLVPPALLGLWGDRQVWVTEPRRLAARWAARRAAQGIGEEAGDTVGWHVRLERVGGDRTRLWYLTEGMLVRRIVEDPLLAGTGVVVLDEFHERSLAGDLCLAWIRRLQQGPRKDLRLLVMSATLRLEALREALDARTVEAGGRPFPVEVRHLSREDPRPLPVRVAEAVGRAAQVPGGDLLVFLPGAREIREAMEVAGPLSERLGLRLEALHGEMSLAAQDRALAPADRRKAIFATNVAESSLTVPGVSGVIDSGLVRRATWNPWSGLPGLESGPACRHSLVQRTGRAGRTGPGTCWRLYTERDFQTRPEEDPPEVVRADLSEAVLLLRALEVRGPGDLPWLTPPPRAAWDAAEELLRRLRLLDPSGDLTERGRQVVRLPLHPRLGVLVAEAGRRGDLGLGCGMAVLLAEGALRDGFEPGRTKRPGARGPCPDPVEEALARWPEHRANAGGGAPTDRLSVLRRDLADLASRAGLGRASGSAPADRETPGSRALLAAFPDRLARARRPASSPREWELVWPLGGSSRAPDDGSFREGFYVVPDALVVEGSGWIRIGAARRVQEDDWIDVLLDDLRETREVRWVPEGERVETVRCLWHGRLLLEERPHRDPSPEAEDLLARKAMERGLASLVGPGEDLEGILARVDFLAARRPDLEWPVLDREWMEAVIREACRGCRSLDEVRERGIAWSGIWTDRQREALRRLAPEHVVLPGGRRLRIRWVRGDAPSVASRIQDFFGMSQGPTLPEGGGPLRLHLLGPGGQEVQVTTDLASFWRDHYPVVAREMRRRYPRHAWPEDPLRASPPGPGRTR
ncbi:ATP-dependent helicase HrpB [Myxococcota bacterium]|nr:ATP-dependent helicase HrpB [Myxococcota bacterium]